PVGAGGAQEHDRPVGGAAVVILVPGRPRLRLDLDVDAHLAQRRLDELRRRLGAAAVLDRIQDDLEPRAALRPDPVGTGLPAGFREQRLSLRRVERIAWRSVGSSSMAAVSGAKAFSAMRLKPVAW